MFRLMSHNEHSINAKKVASWLHPDFPSHVSAKIKIRRNCLPKSTSYAQLSVTSFYFWIPFANRERSAMYVQMWTITYFNIWSTSVSLSLFMLPKQNEEIGIRKIGHVFRTSKGTTKNYRLMHFYTFFVVWMNVRNVFSRRWVFFFEGEQAEIYACMMMIGPSFTIRQPTIEWKKKTI